MVEHAPSKLFSTPTACAGAAACYHCGLPVTGTVSAEPDLKVFCCYGCRLVHELTGERGEEGHSQWLLLRVGLGLFLTMNIMVFSAYFYSLEWYEWKPAPSEVAAFQVVDTFFRYLLLVLTGAVLLLLGSPYLRDSLESLRQGRIEINLLILLGTASAYLLSVFSTLRGEGPVYYDTTAMILLLVTLGHYLDSKARLQTMAASSTLFDRMQEDAKVWQGGEWVDRPASEVREGDRVLCLPGGMIPVDGRVLSGHSSLDESNLTGEHQPRAVAPGEDVISGTFNLDGRLEIETLVGGDQRAIEKLKRILEEARKTQPPIQKVADRIATFFIPFVLLLATATFVYWWRQSDDLGVPILNALSVLLISCPCALGLAAPIACWTAIRRAAEVGILFKTSAALERTARASRMFFDKTGTLTDKETGSVEMELLAATFSQQEVWSIAAGLESGLKHPFARGVEAAALSKGFSPRRFDIVRQLPGLGIEGTTPEGAGWRIGSANLFPAGDSLGSAAKNSQVETWKKEGRSVAFLGCGTQPVAVFSLRERLRPEARAVLKQLIQANLRVEILSGDTPQSVAAVCRDLDVGGQGGLLPEGKWKILRAAAERGEGTLMIGDGVNDAPALAEAAVGVVMGSGADLTREAGDVLLVADDLSRLPLLVDIARDAFAKIRLNMAWSFTYNSVGLGLAAAGLLNPIFAAVSMFASSAFILINSRRVGRNLVGLPGTVDPLG